jgi:cell division protein FtsL
MIRAIVIGTLAVAVVGSGIGVVLTRHESRKLFVDFQKLEAERDRMNDEWGQLQLEQATWGLPARVEDIAHSKLQMELPQPQSTIMVSE